jgi:disulfide bond formation protein DsbB
MSVMSMSATRLSPPTLAALLVAAGGAATILGAYFFQYVLGSAGLAAYHAGVEWKWWPGPSDCSGPITGMGSATDLLRRMQSEIVVRCDDAAWRFLGLSLAGYNVLISIALAAVAGWGVAMGRSSPQG